MIRANTYPRLLSNEPKPSGKGFQVDPQVELLYPVFQCSPAGTTLWQVFTSRSRADHLVSTFNEYAGNNFRAYVGTPVQSVKVFGRKGGEL